MSHNIWIGYKQVQQVNVRAWSDNYFYLIVCLQAKHLHMQTFIDQYQSQNKLEPWPSVLPLKSHSDRTM